MRKAIIAIMAVFLVAVFTGCGMSNWSRESNISGDQKPAIGNIEHRNQAIKMDVIDEIPQLDIIIVRFIDAGHTRYIAVRKDSITTISETSEKSGKTNIYEDESISVGK